MTLKTLQFIQVGHVMKNLIVEFIQNWVRIHLTKIPNYVRKVLNVNGTKQPAAKVWNVYPSTNFVTDMATALRTAMSGIFVKISVKLATGKIKSRDEIDSSEIRAADISSKIFKSHLSIS